MVGMCMGQENGVNVSRLHASERKICLQLPAPLLEAASPRVDKDRTAPSAYQVAVDMDRGWGVQACVLLQLGRLHGIDVGKQTETC